jgi:hypothetical protein
MQHIKMLQDSLSSYIKLSRHGLECLCQFIFGLMMVNDVNLTKIARSFCSEALIDSSYKRLQRFLRHITFQPSWVWLLVSNIFSLPKKIYLAMDRTNWKFGKVNINILTIAIIYKGIAIPVHWVLLPKRGNSNHEERINLIQSLLTFIPKDRIAGLLADREFIGDIWLKALVKMELPFVIRTKSNVTASNTQGILLPIKTMLRGIKPGKAVVFPKRRLVMGCKLYIVAKRLSDGKLLVLLTEAEPGQALDSYLLRWEIESLFSCLKTRGFNFENTHLNKLDRVSNLMFVLTIAFIWAYRQGEITAQAKPPTLKKHGYVSKSLYRLGLETISNALFKMIKSPSCIIQLIEKLFRPETLRHKPLQGGVL